MKKPIFSETQKREWMFPEVEVLKLKLRRLIDQSIIGRAMHFTVAQLAKIL